MARYTASTAEITSIANAIRAKTNNNSPLVFPTGFVSAINNIPVTNELTWMGSNVELADTLYDQTIKLSETSFDASAVTTNNTTIYAFSALPSINLSASYDYTQLIKVIGKFQYMSSLQQVAHPLYTHWIGFYPFGRKPATANDFINNNFNYVVYGAGGGVQNTIFYSRYDALQLTANPYGFNFQIQAPVFTNRYDSAFGCTLYGPNIRIMSHNDYFGADGINALDTENTTFHIIIELYRSDQNNILHWCNQEAVRLYQQEYNTTT